MLNILIGCVIGAVVCVVSSKVYNWVKAEVAKAEADVKSKV